MGGEYVGSDSTGETEIPSWVLAVGPFLLVGVLVALGLVAHATFEFEWLAIDGTGNTLAVLTVIGFVAGILPVVVGMLWFPFFTRLDPGWIHAILAFSAGILAFIAVEMSAEAVAHVGDAGTPTVAGGLAAAAGLATVGLMELGSRWRKRTAAAVEGTDGRGLTIAYLVAIGLGLHSVGEGLAIGVAFVEQQATLVVLLTVGFIIHNVTEGPAVIAAVARERARPPLGHFAALALLAGGGVIVGGWIGSFAFSPLVAALFFAVAAGAIVQVTWEMFDLVRTDAEEVFDRRLVVAFVVGVFLLFFLEEIVVEGWLGA